MIDEFLNLFFGLGKGNRKQKLYPESEYRVEIDEDEIRCFSPDGSSESVRIKELQRFDILTNDLGPFAPDVFWVFSSTHGTCVIPQGATGDNQILNWVHDNLDSFDSEQFIQAMGSTDNNSFLIWSKSPISAA